MFGGRTPQFLRLALRLRGRSLPAQAGVLALTVSSWAIAEEVDVKYRGRLDLAPFKCTDLTRSSFIRRVCYDKGERYMLISLNGTYYRYCNIPESTVAAFMSSDSMGRFFNAQVKGHFDCRLNPAPRY